MLYSIRLLCNASMVVYYFFAGEPLNGVAQVRQTDNMQMPDAYIESAVFIQLTPFMCTH